VTAISIAVVSDTKQAAQSVQALSADYSSLLDQLKQLGPDGSAAADQLEASMKAAQLATQDAAAASKQLVGDINAAKLAAAEGGISVAEPMRETATATEAATGSFGRFQSKGEELKQGLAFNASFGLPMLVEQLGTGKGGVAGTATSAAQALGSMGMMMGPEVMIPAALLGGALSFLGAKLAENDAEAQAVAANTQDLVSSWVKAHPAATEFGKAIEAWLTSTKDFGISLTDLKRDTSTLGVGMTDAAHAMTDHNLPALEQMRRSMDQLNASSNEQLLNAIAVRRSGLSASAAAQEEATKRVQASGDVKKALDQQIASIKQANAAEQLAADEMGLTEQQYKAYADSVDGLTSKLDANKAANDQMTSSLESSMTVSGKTLDNILDRSKKDADAILRNQQKSIEANKRYLTDLNTAVSEGLTEAGQTWVTQNRESFQEVIDTYGAHSKQARQFIANANALGAQSSAEFAAKFNSGVKHGLAEAQALLRYQKLHPDIDVSGLRRDIQNAISGGYYTVDLQPVFHNVPGNGRLGVKIG